MRDIITKAVFSATFIVGALIWGALVATAISNTVVAVIVTWILWAVAIVVMYHYHDKWRINRLMKGIKQKESKENQVD
ncbi:MAG TPA: hypothetical protein VFE32_13815 [Puia sp.]|jgi:membrane protein implicated in regulation of membrane protease activity|nr:hypothetical protein [Puia sp.]